MNNPYTPSILERAEKNKKRHERKHLRPQVWKQWIEDENEEEIVLNQQGIEEEINEN